MTNIKKVDLFQKVTKIIDQAKNNIVRSINSNMVLTYWLIGKEIVEEIQKGKNRAEYGQELIKNLSEQLTKKYGKGYSEPNLKNFRRFYLAFQHRGKSYPVGTESSSSKSYPVGSHFKLELNPNLGWSHYRALMRVKNKNARDFYEQEAVECYWSKRDLERHIHSQYFERILKNQNSQEKNNFASDITTKSSISADLLKNPYVLEFLGLPESSTLHESQLESAIITHLKEFLLELGKGFAFVGRQKRLSFDGKDYFIDLVFYNCILKFYLLIDLKIGELSHQDVGQMDGYVRMFDDVYTANDDNPTIGLILCTDKNESVAKYSVLNERKQVHASKYMLYLPSEEELALEIQKETLLIEESLEKVEIDE